jgi:lycopene beta-cyclase
MTKPLPLVIAGGGLAGCLVALALVARRPDVDILLVEQEATFGGNHIWSFFNSDVAAKDRWLLDPVIGKSWPDHEVRFPHRQRRIGIGYNSIRSTDLDAEVRKQLRTDQYRLGIRIEDISPTRLVLTGGEQIEGIGVIDARGMAPVSGLDLGWQKFVGRTYAFDGPHGVDRPIIMDATVAQDDGYRFVYSLPFSNDELMVEDTYYSTSPVLDPTLIRARLERLVAKGDGPAPVVRSEETGVRPVRVGARI